MNNPLLDAMDAIEKEQTPEQDELLGAMDTVEQQTDPEEINRILQYNHETLQESLQEFFKNNPYDEKNKRYNNRKMIINRKKIKRKTPGEKLAGGLVQGGIGLYEGTFPFLRGDPALPKPEGDAGWWDYMRWYAGHTGLTHQTAGAIGKAGEIAGGIYKIGAGIAEGTAELISLPILNLMDSIEKKIPFPTRYRDGKWTKGFEKSAYEQTDVLKPFVDFIKGSFQPYERKRALATSMSILLSDNIDHINQILDAYYAPTKEGEEKPDFAKTEEMLGRNMGGQMHPRKRLIERDYTEADVAEVLTFLKKEFDSIEMTPEQWNQAHEFFGGFTAKYATKEEFRKVMREDMWEVMLDAVDLWEINQVSKLARRTPTGRPKPGDPGSAIGPEGAAKQPEVFPEIERPSIVGDIDKSISKQPDIIPPQTERMRFPLYQSLTDDARSPLSKLNLGDTPNVKPPKPPGSSIINNLFPPGNFAPVTPEGF